MPFVFSVFVCLLILSSKAPWRSVLVSSAMKDNTIIPLSNRQNGYVRRPIPWVTAFCPSALWAQWSLLSGICPKVCNRVLATAAECLYTASFCRPTDYWDFIFVELYTFIKGPTHPRCRAWVCMFSSTKLLIFICIFWERVSYLQYSLPWIRGGGGCGNWSDSLLLHLFNWNLGLSLAGSGCRRQKTA